MVGVVVAISGIGWLVSYRAAHHLLWNATSLEIEDFVTDAFRSADGIRLTPSPAGQAGEPYFIKDKSTLAALANSFKVTSEPQDVFLATTETCRIDIHGPKVVRLDVAANHVVVNYRGARSKAVQADQDWIRTIEGLTGMTLYP